MSRLNLSGTLKSAISNSFIDVSFFRSLIFFFFFCSQRIGVRFFYASALVYMLYLANLTLYLLCAQGIHLVSQNEDGALFTGHVSRYTALHVTYP